MYQWPKANASWQSERVNALENVIASDETYNFSNMFDDVMDVPTMANTMNNNRKRTFSARLIAASERNQVRELNYNAPTVIDSNNNHPKRMRNDSNYQSQIPKTQTSGLLQTMGKENSSTERNGSAALLRKSNVGDRAGPRVISGSVKTAMDYNKNRSGLDTLYEIFGELKNLQLNLSLMSIEHSLIFFFKIIFRCSKCNWIAFRQTFIGENCSSTYGTVSVCVELRLLRC